MSPLVAWLVLTFLVCVPAQDINSDYTLDEAQNATDSRPHNGSMQTATTSSPEHENRQEPQNPNEHRDKWPGLKFNPPDFVPFPRKGRVTEFWVDHPDFKGIPDLPAQDIEYPKWLVASMGRIRPTTPDPPVLLPSKSRSIEPAEVRPSDSRRLEFESEDLDPSTLPNQNYMNSRYEGNNIPDQTGTGNTEIILPPEVPIQQPFLNSRIQNVQSVPNVIPRQTERDINSDLPQHQYRPILFRIPLTLGLGRIQHIQISNSQRNPDNLDLVSDNRFEGRPSSSSSIESEQMRPMQRQNFRGIPVTISRPSVVNQPGVLMVPMRNRNMLSRFRQPDFFQPRPSRIMFPINQNRPQNPSFDRHNSIWVDPQFSREPLPMAPDNDDNSQRIPTPLTNRRQTFQEPGKQTHPWQNTPIQSNRPSSFPRRSGIGARNKRQSDYESFEPFGMGNMFSFFPPEKKPRNSFNWFPRESMMNSPTHQSPINSGGFIPRVNGRPTKKQIRVPQNAWRIRPTSSNKMAPNYRNQNPQTYHEPNTNNNNNNREIPDDFMIIRPNKASSQNGRSNRMPWMINNLFGGDLFPDNGDNQMWTFQKPLDRQSGTNNNQQLPQGVDRGPYPNNARTRPYQEETISPPYNQRPQFQPPVYQPAQNFNPNRGQGHHSHIDNNMQRPSNHLPPPMNRDNINQGPIQSPPYLEQSATHDQPQEKWRPAPQRPVQPQVPVAPHGRWIPKKSTQKNPPVIKSNHFHEVPRPHHRQPQHQQPHSNHHLKEQSSRPTKVHIHTEGSHQTHRTNILPEIQKGKRKLSPSEVRHLLSLLPEFPKEVYKNPRQKGHTTINTTGNRQKRTLDDPALESADNNDGNFTRNYPGSNEKDQPDFFYDNDSNVTQLPVSLHRTRRSINERKRRDVKESLIQDVVFGSYGYHSEHGYQDGPYSDFSSPFFGFMTGNKLDDISGEWGNTFPKESHHLFNDWDWPNHGYYGRPHHGFGHFLLSHDAGHPHPDFDLSNYWHRNMHPMNEGGRRRVVVIPPAVPRANPDQLSYTARFRYRFGIYPGYSDFIPATDDHEIFFFYDDDAQKDRSPDAVVPFRVY